MQRCAEVSLEVARACLGQAQVLEEVRFVLFGEPALRVFEMVNDAERVAEQMARLDNDVAEHLRQCRLALPAVLLGRRAPLRPPWAVEG